MSSIPSSKSLPTILSQAVSRPLRKGFWILIALGILILLLFYAFHFFVKTEEKLGYETKAAEIGEISLIVSTAGNLAPTNQIIISSELSGRIVEVSVDTNDLVKKGQILAKLDTTRLEQKTESSRANLLASEAKVKLAEATLAEQKSSLARQEELYRLSGGKTPSPASMDSARAVVARALAERESAVALVASSEAEVRSFEIDLEKTLIRSPVDGVVLSRSVDVGQTVAASFTAPTLFTIAEDLKKMELIVNVSEADIGRIQVGQKASFSVDAWPSRSYSAEIKKVAYGALGTGNQAGANGGGGGGGGQGNQVVSYSTELEVSNEDLSLRPGMTAIVEIQIMEKKDILIVPNTALRFNPTFALESLKPKETGKTIVQTLSPSGKSWRKAPPKAGAMDSRTQVWMMKDGLPSAVPVQLGISDGTYTEIASQNLREGDEVIINIKPQKAE